MHERGKNVTRGVLFLLYKNQLISVVAAVLGFGEKFAFRCIWKNACPRKYQKSIPVAIAANIIRVFNSRVPIDFAGVSVYNGRKL